MKRRPKKWVKSPRRRSMMKRVKTSRWRSVKVKVKAEMKSQGIRSPTRRRRSSK